MKVSSIGTRLSLRFIIGGSAIMALGLALLLIVATSVLSGAAEAIDRDAEGRRLANQLHREVLNYNRLSNLHNVQPSRDVALSLANGESDIADLLAQIRKHVDSPQERAFVDRAAELVAAFLQARQALDAQEREVATIIIGIAPVMSRATAAIEGLALFNHQQMLAARSRAMRWKQASNVLGVLAAVGSGLVMVLLLVATRFVLQPLSEISRELRRFRPDQPKRRPELDSLDSPAEVSRLGESFNTMADSLAAHRDRQLEFFAGVAHDLRDPLSTLKLGLERLSSTPGLEQRPEIREALPRLDRQIDRLTRMANDLVDVVNAEAGRLVLQPSDIDLRHVVAESVARHKTDSAAHSIRVSLPDEEVPLHADSDRLEQVVDNLLTNALKYSPKGGPIDVAVSQTEESASLSVTDRGVGIAPEQQALMFQPFRRLQNVGSAPGLGIGLSVARRIVEAHDGWIEVKSEPGEGATLTVHLPLRCSRGTA